MRYPTILLNAIVALILPASGANFSFIGAFAQDDERRQFTFALSQPGTVLIRTWSYAGGVNSTGARIEAGGFDPSLSLFDSTGLLLAANRDGGCGKVAADPVTTSCWDAFVAATLPSGTYQLVLTESENMPFGPNLTDPFVYDGAGNFTAAPGITLPAGFWDFWPDRRNNSYAVDISGVDSAQFPLGPSTGALVNGASWQAGPAGPNTILTLFYRSLPGAQPLRVLIDGQSAELLYNGPTQLNFVVPPSAIPSERILADLERRQSFAGDAAADCRRIPGAVHCRPIGNRAGQHPESGLHLQWSRRPCRARCAWIDPNGVRNGLRRRKSCRTGRPFLATRGGGRNHRGP